MKDVLGRLPTLAKQRQALWFHGEPGIGKRMIAKRYAALLGKPVVRLTREVAKAGIPEGCVLWIEDLSVLKTKDPLPMKGVIGVVVSELSPDAARSQGLLNEAWYFSQNMQVMSIAPMRYRKEDVLALVEDTIDRLSAMMTIDEPTLKRLRSTSPPDDTDIDGIRKWVMGQVVAVKNTRTTAIADVKSWDEQSAEALKLVLDACGGRIYGKGGAAAKLGLKPTTLQSKLKRLGVR
jgi:DNA-binding NtrC family response regulator